jgi:hypothetical protein
MIHLVFWFAVTIFNEFMLSTFGRLLVRLESSLTLPLTVEGQTCMVFGRMPMSFGMWMVPTDVGLWRVPM